MMSFSRSMDSLSSLTWASLWTRSLQADVDREVISMSASRLISIGIISALEAETLN